ncbi:uncharacterized protein TNCV_3009321 [Trichonephila clavipes]|nr:uncharacterized protein TNCV_3009321 [Trichonephila clavipes]
MFLHVSLRHSLIFIATFQKLGTEPRAPSGRASSECGLEGEKDFNDDHREEITDFVQSIPGFPKCDEEDVENWMACDTEDCGFQMLNDDEILTSVQEESTLSTMKRMKTRTTTTKVARVHQMLTRFLRLRQLWSGDGRQSGLLILIDDGSQTEEESLSVICGSTMDVRGLPTKKCPGVSVSKSSKFDVKGVSGREFSTASISQSIVMNSSRVKCAFPTTLFKWNLNAFTPASHSPPWNRLTCQQFAHFFIELPFHAMSGSASSQHDLPPVK